MPTAARTLFDEFISEGALLAREILANGNKEQRGAVFTKREVVEFILDLVGYTSDKDLTSLRLLEPSFGAGDFLIPAIERLIESVKRSGLNLNEAIPSLKSAVRGVELHRQSFNETRERICELLSVNGLTYSDCSELLDDWLHQDDFLLRSFPSVFTHIVGNPPYVRQELIPEDLINEYRSRFSTIYDRADLYVPFIEHSLRLLTQDGKLGFICSDRWMKNRYGKRLRQLVATDFHLEIFVDMVDSPAFHSDVVAYPAITVIKRSAPGATRIAHRPQVDSDALSQLVREFKSDAPSKLVTEIQAVGNGSEPWILENLDKLAIVRKLEVRFPTLEEASCLVGIGVATGADRAFIGPIDELDVEDDRKIPLAMTKDIVSGIVQWRGLAVVNPFGDDGRLVDLRRFPRLAIHLERHLTEVRNRHVSRKNPESWYRTIDRIYPEIAKQPKLLIPDIKGQAQIVFEKGELYPHHNLYFITSRDWDLRALQTVLTTGIARLFVGTYSTKMRGGFLRFQAQYLRRIRLPYWKDISDELRTALVDPAASDDPEYCRRIVAEVYHLSEAEMSLICG